MDAEAGDHWLSAASRLSAAQLEFETQKQRFEEARARLQATFDQVRDGRPRREVLHRAAFARLQAKLDTMPVIEQAKGVLMAQHHCGPDEAFDLLRRASQRANVKVSVLAQQIVTQVASPQPEQVPPRPRPGRAAARGTAQSQVRRQAAGLRPSAPGRPATPRGEIYSFYDIFTRMRRMPSAAPWRRNNYRHASDWTCSGR